MYNWKGRFQYKLKLINGRQSSSDKKHNISLRLVLFFPSAVVSPALHRFLYRQWNKRNYSTPFLKCFSLFLTRKNSLRKNFSPRMCAKRRSANSEKRWEFWRETHSTPLWLLIGRIIFLTCEETSFAILIGRIIVFTCLNHSSLLWLARSHLRIKIYNTTFWWVSSQYVYNKCKYFFAPL